MIVLPRLDNHQTWADAAKDPRAVGDVVEALSGFRTLLGEKWTGWTNGVPFSVQFFVRLQHEPPEGVRIWKMVQELHGVSGLAYFVRDGLKQKAWREYVATVMALEFCSRVRAAGGDVEFVQRDHEKSPDTRVRLVDRWITVEFKALHDRDEMEAWYVFEQRVMDGLTRRGAVAAVFDRELTPAALTDHEAVVDGLASIKERDVREYEDLPRGTGRARLAPINSGKCGYPMEQKPELVRLTSKVCSKDWREQLQRAGGPTLLVVRTTTLFGDGSPASVGAAARRITDALNVRLPGLGMMGAVLVYEEPFWAPRFPIHAEADDSRVRIDTSPAGCARFMALTTNAHATDPLAEAELDRLVGSKPIW